ncbi:MAG: Smr/MutS family endonuclease [Gammaproteobacteria bacterium]|nr:Smr/MutS family endonuclease [Gammaproteobacteria bacterium]
MSIKKPESKSRSSKSKISDDELQFFREAVADVRPLTSEKRVMPITKPANIRIRQTNEVNNNMTVEPMSDPVDLRDIEITDNLFYARSGIQLKVQKKLRRGEFAIEDELDLHGYTVAEAKQAINEFLAQCKRNNIRCIRIIHGKGYRSEQKIPILKTYVAYWLPQHPDVMAFSSARPIDGGTGALYVLLKVVR